ncbi:MAG: winged helix-turn-helix transcriptional regulator, partial [Candidatus Daviesbacteria bacterium]|nr:winged helix-turn-helix transcriptional regulator [Candidatus Daviesbacteria bacterium]
MALTPKQKRILEFITSYQQSKGFSPTHKEIGKKFRLAVSTVHEHLSALEKKGYIKKERGHARTIEATRPHKNSGLVKIPLLGTISAGQPLSLFDVPRETIAVPKSKIPSSSEVYALRVVGNSMI